MFTWFEQSLHERLVEVEVEPLVGVDVVPDPGQQQQVEEALRHFLVKSADKDLGCLEGGRGGPLLRARQQRQLLPVPELRDDLEGLGHLARPVPLEDSAHALVHLYHARVQLGAAEALRVGELGVDLRLALLDLLHDDVGQCLSGLGVRAAEGVEGRLVLLADAQLRRHPAGVQVGGDATDVVLLLFIVGDVPLFVAVLSRGPVRRQPDRPGLLPGPGVRPALGLPLQLLQLPPGLRQDLLGEPPVHHLLVPVRPASGPALLGATGRRGQLALKEGHWVNVILRERASPSSSSPG